MIPPGESAPVAGVCHARRDNADLPPAWLMYVNVLDLDASLARCAGRGGSALDGPRAMGEMGRLAVIRDPRGATLALFEPEAG